MRRFPSLNALRAFEAAARHSNFTQAAEELCVTQAAVSQQVRRLEAELRVSLFQRGARGVSLTKAGVQYLAVLQKAFNHIADGTEELLSQRADDVLRVCSLPTFATRWLIPRLEAFQAAHPKIKLQLTVSLQAVDFAREDIDAAIWHGREPCGSLEAHRLFGQDLVPVCSPAILRDRYRPLRTPRDLGHHTLLHVARERNDWHTWLTAANVEGIDTKGGPSFEATHMALQAAVRGMGVAIGRQPFLEEDLEMGRLVTPFELRVQTESAYYLTYLKDARTLHRLHSFRDWLLSEVRAHGGTQFRRS